jgi:hypothetical protein
VPWRTSGAEIPDHKEVHSPRAEHVAFECLDLGLWCVAGGSHNDDRAFGAMISDAPPRKELKFQIFLARD